jgi:D-alanine-D-alanine ligase
MKVAVLKGGRSLERQVSLRSGARVEDALHRLGHEVVPIDVGADLVDRLEQVRPEVAFVALHGRGGEDGTVQELLELVGIPYTASGPSACIRCMDKVVAKHELRDAGLPTPDFYAFSQAAFEELGAARALPAIEERLEFPIVVKPAGQGSALGVKFARTAEDVPGAIVAALSYDTKVLLERYVAGRDLAVSVLDGPDGPEALPVVEAVPLEEDFYDFEARYEIGRTSFTCPADIGPEATARAQELALAAWTTLRCEGFARIDLMLDGTGELYVLEANAIPGLTDTSLLPLAADAAGVGFDTLIARIVELAVARAPA